MMSQSSFDIELKEGSMLEIVNGSNELYIYVVSERWEDDEAGNCTLPKSSVPALIGWLAEHLAE